MGIDEMLEALDGILDVGDSLDSSGIGISAMTGCFAASSSSFFSSSVFLISVFLFLPNKSEQTPTPANTCSCC